MKCVIKIEQRCYLYSISCMRTTNGSAINVMFYYLCVKFSKKMKCPYCNSEKTKKNGHTHYGKQNHLCHVCKRQFVEGGASWFVSSYEKSLIDKLLLERLSLSGICRVMNISESWLSGYIKTLYSNLPEDLNASTELPDKGDYLSDRFEEEVVRIVKKKEHRLVDTYVNVMDINHCEVEKSSEDESLNIDNESFIDYYDGLDNAFSEDLLIEELYSKERGRRVEFFGIQLDEMWSFVGNKENKQWIWLALNPANRQIIAFHVGGRGTHDAQLFYDKIPSIFKENAAFFSDYWQPYVNTFGNHDHFGVGKDSGLTAYIERFNNTMRQMVARLVRKSLSFSKSLDNHIGAIKYFICNYNLKIAALHL